MKKIFLSALYVFLPLIISRIFIEQQSEIVVGHEVISELVIASIFILSKGKERLFGMAFFVLALADFLYGGTSEIVLNSQSTIPSVIVREFSYTLFSALLSIFLIREYIHLFRNRKTFIWIVLLFSFFTFLGHKYIITPLYVKPDHAMIFVISGSLYSVFRAITLAIAIQQMVFERKFVRFIFLYSLTQMYVCDLALNFQLNALDGVKTPLNTWFETGWALSVATFCAMTVYQRLNNRALIGHSEVATWRSFRVLTPFLVMLVLLVQGFWLWLFDFLKFSNLLEVTHFVSLGFLGWVMANSFGILVAAQFENVIKPSNTRRGHEYFALDEIQQAIQHVVKIERQLEDKKWLARMGEFASQVAHDIRSPLSALNLILGSANELSEDKRLIIRGAVQRINDIANGLLKQSTEKKSELLEKQSSHSEPVMLVALLDSIISEKRTQFREKIHVEIEENLVKGYGLFSKINPTELSRVISNLVNNSIEAFERSIGKVNIEIFSTSDLITITVQDNGKGIPSEILTQLGQRGVSHGKQGTHSGSGLGVYHARETIEAAGGRLMITSTVGKGTRITITLPKCDAPAWFVDKIKIQQGQVLVSVDDDQSIHQIWSERFASELPKGIKFEHFKFSSLEKFAEWVKEHHKAHNEYLIDYEFVGQKGNGLDLIEQLNIQKQSILVTSRYEDPKIQEKVKALGLMVLPKGLAPLVPIRIK